MDREYYGMPEEVAVMYEVKETEPIDSVDDTEIIPEDDGKPKKRGRKKE